MDGTRFDDIKQGLLGDCYFLSVLSVLAEHEGAIEKVVLTKKLNTAGVFAARCVPSASTHSGGTCTHSRGHMHPL